MPAFIHGELEQKILMLYVLARLEEPVPFETLLDLCLCDDGLNYFDFTERLQELIDTEHILYSDGKRYAITEKGRRVSEICEAELPYTVRVRCDRSTEICNRALRREEQVRSSVEARSNGTFTVRMVLDDDIGNLMDLQVVAPQKQLADALIRNFQQRPEQIYSRLMDLLLQEEPDEPESV